MEESKNPEQVTETAETAQAAAPETAAAEAPEKKERKAHKKDAKDTAEHKRQQHTVELENLKKELQDQKDAYQRMLAEYANYKRRTEQEKEQLGAFTRAEVIKKLLPALDNLERAAAAPAGEEYKTGVVMTIRQLNDILKEMGLEVYQKGYKMGDRVLRPSMVKVAN